MNIYLLSQRVNSEYDTYSDCIVAAESEDEARLIMPDKHDTWGDEYSTWAHDPSQVTVQLIGHATMSIKKGVILASFHAS